MRILNNLHILYDKLNILKKESIPKKNINLMIEKLKYMIINLRALEIIEWGQLRNHIKRNILLYENTNYKGLIDKIDELDKICQLDSKELLNQITNFIQIFKQTPIIDISRKLLFVSKLARLSEVKFIQEKSIFNFF